MAPTTLMKELSFLLDQTHQMAHQKPPKQREREATAGALFLGHLALCFELKEMASNSFKGEVNQREGQSQQRRSQSQQVDFSRTHGSS